jgi:hypothetical protein
MYDYNKVYQLTAQILGYVIRRKMNLPKPNVWLRDQNRVIPNDNGIYVAIGLINAPQPLGVVTYIKEGIFTSYDQSNESWDVPSEIWDPEANPTQYDQLGQSFDNPDQNWDVTPPILLEVNEIIQREDIQIDFFSRSNDGIKRNWEIIAALNSIFCQQMQERFNFKVARLPRAFVNTSYAEGGSQLNRFTLTFSTIVWYRKETPLTPTGGGYYDAFETRVDTSKTIGTNLPQYDQPDGQWDQPGQTYDGPGPVAEFEIEGDSIT